MGAVFADNSVGATCALTSRRSCDACPHSGVPDNRILMSFNPASATGIETREIPPEYKHEHHRILGYPA